MNQNGTAIFSRVKIYTNMSDAAADWVQLEPASPTTAYESYAFANAWMETFGLHHGVRPFIIIAYDKENCPIAILPLVTKRSGPVTVAVFLGAPEADCHFGLFRNPDDFGTANLRELLHQAGSTAQKKPDIYILQKLVAELNGKQNPFWRLPDKKIGVTSWVVNLAPDMKAYLKSQFTPRQLNSVAGIKRRRMEKLGLVEYFIPVTDEDTTKAIDELIFQKRERFNKFKIKSNYADSTMRSFALLLSDYCSKFKNATSEWHTLKVDGRIVAIFMGIIYQGTFYNFLKSMASDKKIHRCSPGHVLQMHVYENLAARGIFRVDMGDGGDNDKKIFSNQPTPMFDIVYPLSPLGHAAALSLKQFQWAKQKIKKSTWAYALALKIKALMTGKHFRGEA